MRNSRWAVPAGAVLAVTLALSAAGPAGATATPESQPLRQCHTVDIPVALAPGDAANQQISAEYCRPYGQATAAIDVLVPGATYNHTYWDWPVDPPVYSYVDKTLQAGRSVLDIDRIGTGASSHPVSTDITIAADVYTVHQVITWARQTAGYGQVNLIGHSLGSIIASQDAAQWPQDPTRLVLTGLLHEVPGGVLQALTSDIYSADQDPLFAESGLDAGYLTTVPGDRSTMFYYDGALGVIAYDEAHKDVVSGTEFSQTGPAIQASAPSSPTLGITAPVLLVMGQEDPLFCEGTGAPDCADPAAIQAEEAPYYPNAASLTTETIPGTGHDIALHPTAGQSFQAINTWLNTQG